MLPNRILNSLSNFFMILTLLLNIIKAQIFIKGPEDLVQSFKSLKITNEVLGSYTNFGKIPYGQTIVIIYIVNISLEDYTIVHWKISHEEVVQTYHLNLSFQIIQIILFYDRLFLLKREYVQFLPK